MTHAHYRLFAPAKINIDLRITGRRDDGYHTIDSHILFADWGDDIALSIADAPETMCQLHVSGPFADHTKSVADADNLAVRAATAFCAHHDLALDIRIDLTKNIPARAGLGGGSADAAAILRGLVHHTGLSAPLDLQLSLGADVPVCYTAQPARVTGIGDSVTPWDNPPATHAIIAWNEPGPTTAELYAAFDAQGAASSGPNDFEPVAIRLTPAIADHLSALRALPGCGEARLTGSGNAVFGLFSAPPPLPETHEFTLLQPCFLGAFNKPLVTRA